METVDLIAYFNYIFLATVGLSVLFGFWFGAFRSIYFFIGFLVLFILGWIISPFLARTLFTYDISSVGNVIEGIEITSIEGMIPQLLEKAFPEFGDMFSPESAIYKFGTEAILMILRLIAFFVWLIVVIPILTVILWIIYLFVKPKGKKSLVSRLVGIGVTVLHNLLGLFILSIFLSGLTTTLNSAMTLSDISVGPEEVSNQIIFTNQGPVLQLNNNEESFDFIFDFAEQYRDTYLGRMSGLIKIKGTALDEQMFDDLFTINYNKNKIKIRKELITALRIYSLIEENIEGDITLDNFIQLNEEVQTQIVAELKNIKLLQVAIPLGIEFVVKSDMFDEMLSDVEQYLDLEEIMPELLAVNYQDEIGYLGSAFLDALKLGLYNLGTDKEILFTLDVDTVESLFTNVGSLELIKIVGSQLLTSFANSDMAQEFYHEIGFEDDVNLDDVEIDTEIKNFGNIYRAFSNLGITGSDYKTIDFSKISDDDVNQLGAAIYGSKLFSNNSRLLAQTMVRQLPPEYQELLTVSQFDVDDFASIVGLGLVLFSTGFFEDSENVQYTDLLTDTNIEKIAGYISQSGLLSSNVGGILQMLMQTVEMPEDLDIVIDKDFNWSGESGKDEIVAIFTTASKLLELGITDTDTFLNDLNVQKIEELSETLSSSQIFMSNIDNILKFFLNNPEITGGLEFTIREIDWTSEAGKTEFKALLKAVAEIFGCNLLNNPDFTLLTDEQIASLATALAASVIIRDNLSNIITQSVGDSVDFEIAVFDNPDEWTAGEINHLLLAAKIITGKDNYLVFTDEEIDTILSSNLIVNSIVRMLEKYTEPEGQYYDLLIIEGVTEWRDTYVDGVRTDGELRRFFNGARILLGDNPDPDNPDSLIDLNRLLNLTDGTVDPDDDEWGQMLASRVLKQSLINQLIKYGTDEVDEFGNVTKEAVLVVKLEKTDERWDQELRNLFKAVKVVLGDGDLNNIEIDPNIMLDLTTGAEGEETDEVGSILSSIIVTDTIIKQIIKLSDGESDLIINFGEDDSRWYDSEEEAGEIRKLIVAIKIIFNKPDDDLNNPQLDPNIIFELTDGRANPADDEISTILASQIISDTIINQLIELGKDETDEFGNVISESVLVVDLAADDSRWYDDTERPGEIKQLIWGAQALLGENPDLNNPALIEQSEILRLSDDKIDTILASIILSKTIVKEIKKIESLVVPDELQGAENEARWHDNDTEEGELRKLIRVAKLLLDEGTTEVNTDKILNLSETDIDTILESTVIKATIKQELYSVDALVIAEENPDFYWDDRYDGDVRIDGELRKLLLAAPLLIENETVNIDKLLDLDNNQISTLTSSRIIVDSAVRELKAMTAAPTETAPAGSLYEVIYLPEDDEVEYHGTAGEMRRFIIAIQYLVKANTAPGEGIGDIQTISIASLVDENNRDNIIASKIIATTIIVNIENEAAQEGSSVILAPELERTSVEYNPNAWDDELPKFLDAINIFVGSGNIEEISFSDNEFLTMTDDEIDIIVGSRVISYSIIKKLEEEHNSESSLITIPDQYNPGVDEITNEDLWYQGELKRTLQALRELGLSDYEGSFSLNPVFAEAKGEVPEVILASEVIENTIIKRIETEAAPGESLDGVLIIPEGVVWTKTVVAGEVTDCGELRRFLKAIDIILNGDELENATFHVEAFFYDETNPGRQDTLLASVIVETSIINKIETEAAAGGSLYGVLVFPSDWNDNDWYGADGELRKFLSSIKVIIGTDTFETTNFEADKFLGEDRGTLLASRLIEASVVQYIIESADPVTGVLKNVLYLPADLETNDVGWYRSGGGELDRFLDAVKLIVGEESYDQADFAVDTILGSERDTVLASRVVEVSVVQYIIESADPVTGDLKNVLYLPADLETNDVGWYRSGGGELDRFLDAIKLIVGAGSYNQADFAVDTILGSERDTVLASRVVETSAIVYVKESDKLTIPDKSKPDALARYYYFADEDIVWEKTSDDIGELRKFLNGIGFILGDTGNFDTFNFEMDNFLNIDDFSIILTSRTLEATLAAMTEDVIDNILTGFIKEPDNGYQWFYHPTSTEAGLTGEVRRGEFALTATSDQYSDLSGFLNAVKRMNDANLNFNSIDAYTIAAAATDDSAALSTAMWDYSRVLRGSIATMLNETIAQIPIPDEYELFKPTFSDEDFQDKQDVKDALDQFAMFINSLPII
ncbi:MAG: MFS transporter [Bacilli bacterium]|nr:MFS transporter [Bacilli bacterium]